LAGATSCSLCPAGTASSSASAVSVADCEECSAGQFSATAKSTACGDCDSGKFAIAGSSVCTQCQLGLIPVADKSDCEQCSPGQYSPAAGTQDCVPCGAGEVSQAGASSCLQCMARSEPDGNRARCIPCGRGENSLAGGVCRSELAPVVFNVNPSQFSLESTSAVFISGSDFATVTRCLLRASKRNWTLPATLEGQSLTCDFSSAELRVQAVRGRSLFQGAPL
jgi:syndecan 4